MKRFLKFLNKNSYNVFLVLLFLLNVAPILAPIFLHIGWKAPAKVIYFVYSFTCHQFHWRSLHIYDHQCAWCTRDTFIWGSIFVVALLVKLYRVKALKWYWILPFMIPIALDGIIQTVATVAGYDSEYPYYMSTNPMRMLTGATFGTGLGLWMMPTLKEIFEFENPDHKPDKTKKELPIWKIAAITIGGAILAYLIAMLVWTKTSNTYKPTDFLDSQVKTPVEREDWFIRRKNGI